MSFDSSKDLFDELKRRGIEGIHELPTSSFREDPRLDFKETSDKSGPTDVPNLAVFAKAASAFANTSGGVIVWGIEAKDNKPMALKPIPNVRKFCERLMDMKGRVLDPPMSGIESHVIDDQDGKGFVLTLVPSSERKPHAALGKDQQTFYMRAGSNSLPMPTEFVRALMMSNAVPVLRARSALAFSHTTVFADDEEDTVEVPAYECRLHLSLINEGEALAERIAVALPQDSDTRRYGFIGGSVFDAKQWKATNDGVPADLKLCRWPEDRVLYPHMSLEMATVTELFINPERLRGGIGFVSSLYSRSTSYTQVTQTPGSFLKAKFDIWLNETPRRNRDIRDLSEWKFESLDVVDEL